ncbi:MAG TPA: hypothetical protein VMV19_15575 [Xanthobacteraceae bacterium]|nr:hypothetical protein [Xanthobacteraceae bacterium]
MDKTVAIPQFDPDELAFTFLVQPHGLVDCGFVGRATHDFNSPNDTIFQEVASHGLLLA